MDDGVHCLVLDVTYESDKGGVAYITFVQCEYAFERIFEEDIDRSYSRGPFIVCTALSLREFIDFFVCR